MCLSLLNARLCLCRPRYQNAFVTLESVTLKKLQSQILSLFGNTYRWAVQFPLLSQHALTSVHQHCHEYFWKQNIQFGMNNDNIKIIINLKCCAPVGAASLTVRTIALTHWLPHVFWHDRSCQSKRTSLNIFTCCIFLTRFIFMKVNNKVVKYHMCCF